MYESPFNVSIIVFLIITNEIMRCLYEKRGSEGKLQRKCIGKSTEKTFCNLPSAVRNLSGNYRAAIRLRKREADCIYKQKSSETTVPKLLFCDKKQIISKNLIKNHKCLLTLGVSCATITISLEERRKEMNLMALLLSVVLVITVITVITVISIISEVISILAVITNSAGLHAGMPKVHSYLS